MKSLCITDISFLAQKHGGHQEQFCAALSSESLTIQSLNSSRSELLTKILVSASLFAKHSDLVSTPRASKSAPVKRTKVIQRSWMDWKDAAWCVTQAVHTVKQPCSAASEKTATLLQLAAHWKGACRVLTKYQQSQEASHPQQNTCPRQPYTM